MLVLRASSPGRRTNAVREVESVFGETCWSCWKRSGERKPGSAAEAVCCATGLTTKRRRYRR
eukprot:5352917-Alexandrium_andersonii.AAC.1